MKKLFLLGFALVLSSGAMAQESLLGKVSKAKEKTENKAKEIDQKATKAEEKAKKANDKVKKAKTDVANAKTEAKEGVKSAKENVKTAGKKTVDNVKTSAKESVSAEKAPKIADKIVELFDMTPYGIETRLKLRSPIYSETAAYGHMGRENKVVTKEFINGNREKKKLEVELFTWEKLDFVDPIKKAFNIYKTSQKSTLVNS